MKHHLPYLRDLFDQSLRRRCRCAGLEVEQLDRVTRVTGPTASQNENIIIWSDLNESNADQEIEKHLTYFKELEHDFEWFAYGHDEPADLLDRLQAKGFKLESEETVVVAKATHIGEDIPVSGMTIRIITNTDDLKDSLEVSDAVWGNKSHDFVHRWLSKLVGDYPTESTVLVAYDHDRPVGTSWATHWKEGHFASFFGGTVLPDWRGKGIYRAMVATRARIASERGMEWCTVDAGPESFPILERLGFEPITKRFSLCWRYDRAE